MTNPEHDNAQALPGLGAKKITPDQVPPDYSADSGADESLDMVSYSRGSDTFDNAPEQKIAGTFAEFHAAVVADESQRKGLAYICGPLNPAPDDDHHRQVKQRGTGPTVVGMAYRSADTAGARRFMALDLDKGTPDIFTALCEWMACWSGFGYTTASHTADKPRARFIIETDRPMSRAECMTLSEHFRALAWHATGAAFDKSLDRPEQPIFTPVTGSHPFTYDGQPILVDHMLANPPEPIPGDTPSGNGEGQGADGAGTHPSVLKAAQMLAEDVRRGHMTRDEAIRILQARAESGAWERKPPLAEIEGALDGSIRKSNTPRDPPDLSKLPTLRRVDVQGLAAANVEPPRFVISPLVPRRHVTLLGGHGGIGKSTLALTLGAHVACGARWAGLLVEQGRVVCVSLEDPGELVRFRLRNIVEGYGLDAGMVAANLTILDGTEGDTALAVEESVGRRGTLAETATLHEMEAACRGAALVILDNASDAYDASENERRYVRVFVRRMLGRIARANDGGVILLAHIDKQAAKFGAANNSYSGSTAWNNSARSRLALLDVNGGIELHHEKANLSKKHDPIALSFADHGVLMPSLGGNPAAGLNNSVDDAALFACLAAAVAAGESIRTGQAGPGNAHSVAKHLPGFPAGLRRADRFWAALGRLASAGAIVREQYQDKNRKHKERWRIAPVAPDAEN